jgi:hypothetical protein
VLDSGETASGKVLRLDDEKLVLDRGGNYDHEEQIIGLAEIEHAEFRNESDGQIEGALVPGAGGGACGLGLGDASEYGVLRWWGRGRL